jgi:hypothetical protein
MKATPPARQSPTESEIDDDEATAPAIIIVSLGVMPSGKGQLVPSTTTVTIRSDSSGEDINPISMDMDRCNGAVDTGLPVMYSRSSRNLYVIKYDRHGAATSQMSLALTAQDIAEGWTDFSGQKVLRIAVELPSTSSSSSSKPPGKPWSVHGQFGLSRETDGRIQRPEIEPLVIALWEQKGWDFNKETSAHVQAVKYATKLSAD